MTQGTSKVRLRYGEPLREFCDLRTGRSNSGPWAGGMAADGATIVKTTNGAPRSDELRIRVGGFYGPNVPVNRYRVDSGIADVDISADGSTVAYIGDANNLVTGDRPAKSSYGEDDADVFVWDRLPR